MWREKLYVEQITLPQNYLSWIFGVFKLNALPSSSLKSFRNSLPLCRLSNVTTVGCSSLILSSSLVDEDDKDFSDDNDLESNLDSLVVGLGWSSVSVS